MKYFNQIRKASKQLKNAKKHDVAIFIVDKGHPFGLKSSNRGYSVAFKTMSHIPKLKQDILPKKDIYLLQLAMYMNDKTKEVIFNSFLDEVTKQDPKVEVMKPEDFLNKYKCEIEKKLSEYRLMESKEKV